MNFLKVVLGLLVVGTASAETIKVDTLFESEEIYTLRGAELISSQVNLSLLVDSNIAPTYVPSTGPYSVPVWTYKNSIISLSLTGVGANGGQSYSLIPNSFGSVDFSPEVFSTDRGAIFFSAPLVSPSGITRNFYFNQSVQYNPATSAAPTSLLNVFGYSPEQSLIIGAMTINSVTYYNWGGSFKVSVLPSTLFTPLPSSFFLLLGELVLLLSSSRTLLKNSAMPAQS